MDRILIVEDNKMLGDLLTNTVEAMGYNVTLASSGAEALDLLSQFNHEVVFTDVHMEGMNGLDFIATVKQRHPRTVFVFMSGEIDPDLEGRAMAMGALAYIHKPVDINVLHKIVTRAIKRVKRQNAADGFAGTRSSFPGKS